MIKSIANIIKNNLYTISLYARQMSGTMVLLLIARYLTVYDFGIFSSYKNIASFWLVLANLGFADYILVSSKANSTEVKLKISLFMSNAILITTIMCVISNFYNIESHLLFWLVVIRTFFDGTFFSLILPYFQSTKKFNTIATINIIYAVCVSLIAIVSFIFKFTLLKFLVLNILLGFINFIQCSYYAKINYFLFFNNIKRFLGLLDKRIFAYIGTTIAYYLYAQIPPLYVASYLPKEQAALFFAANTIAMLILLLSTAQVQKIIPDLIKGSVDEAKSLMNKNIKFILKCDALIILIAIFGGGLILEMIYGQKYYVNGHLVLVILLLGNIFHTVGAIYGSYLTASGRQRLRIPIQIETTIVTIIGLFVFHKIGIVGVAYTCLFSAIYITIRFITCTRKALITDEKK